MDAGPPFLWLLCAQPPGSSIIQMCTSIYWAHSQGAAGLPSFVVIIKTVLPFGLPEGPKVRERLQSPISLPPCLFNGNQLKRESDAPGAKGAAFKLSSPILLHFFAEHLAPSCKLQGIYSLGECLLSLLHTRTSGFKLEVLSWYFMMCLSRRLWPESF